MKEKRLIAQKASNLVRDGQTLMLDSSSTVTFLLPHIAKHQNVTLYTNNLTTALRSIELGIRTHCLGGYSVNGSTALSGPETFSSLTEITVDILFFSSQSLDEQGNISDATQEENYVRKLMLKSAKTTVFLCDSEKFNSKSTYNLCNLSHIDYAVFDTEYPTLSTKCKIL